MNSAQFLEIIQKADSLAPDDLRQLYEVQKNFPYFQIPYILTANYEQGTDSTEYSNSLAFAAITSPNRIWLKFLIENKIYKHIAPKDDLNEDSKNDEKKVNDNEQQKLIYLIKGISKKEIKLESIKEIEAKQHAINLGVGSGQIKFNLSAASMRLTIVMDVAYINAAVEQETLLRTLTFFKDYDPRTTTFPEIEKEMVDEIFTLIQDILKAPVANSYFPYIQAKRQNHVNASQFLEIIQKTDPLDRSELLQLQRVKENFPYFQIPHVLLARYEIRQNGADTSSALGYAAVTSPNRVWLRSLIEKTNNKTVNPQETSSKPEIKAEEKAPIPTETGPEEVKIEPTKPAPRRRKPPKEDLIETIKKKEKREIVDKKKKEQIDLIKAFSKKEIKLATIKEIEANQNAENLAASSTKINDNLISESFAKILANQGKKQLAKEIYEKLVLKFPDKRAYFADLIEKLKD